MPDSFKRASDSLTNKDIDTICESIESNFLKEQELIKETADRINPIEIPTIPDDDPTIEELRKKYLPDGVNHEVFEDPDMPHDQCGMPLIPELNFSEKNEDIDPDPADGISSNALPWISQGIVSSNFEEKN